MEAEKSLVLERIRRHENELDTLLAWNRLLEEVCIQQETALAAYAGLNEYMESGELLQDMDQDTAGSLPSDLKRGVLSEDGAYNALQDTEELLETMKQMSARLHLLRHA